MPPLWRPPEEVSVPTLRLPVIRWQPLLLSMLFFFLALFLGALIGLGGTRVIALGLIAIVLFFGLLAYGLRVPSQPVLAAVIALVFVVTLVNPLAEGTTHVPIGYLFELLCFAWLAGALVQAWRSYGERPAFRALLLCLAGYFTLSIVSSVFGRSELFAGIWQFQYNLKWPAMLLIGMLLTFDERQERVLNFFAYWLWLPLLLAIGVEIAAPVLHAKLLGLTQLDRTPNPLLGFGVRRQSLFQHSSYLALVSAGLAWLSIVRAVLQRRRAWWVPVLCYVALLALSGQRQEAMAFAGACLLGLALLARRQWRLSLIFGLLALGIAALLAVIFDLTIAQKVLSQWGGGDALAERSERYVLTKHGMEIANHWFPLGSGLGTYGGAGAQKFDQSYFYELGFDQYWWFRLGQFLVDMYWPCVVAEVGWLGGGLLGVAYLVIWFSLLKAIWRGGPANSVVWIAIGLLTVNLLNSPTSAAITDPRGAFWMWLLIGAAFAKSMNAGRVPLGKV
jgi:hypothetical protein